MTRRNITRPIAAFAAIGMSVGATGAASAGTATTAPGDTSGDAATTAATGSASTGAGSSGEPVDLSGVCPDTIVIQTDWFPEAEHGALYEMVGDDYEIDTDAKVVRGSLVSGGADTGVDIEVRTGGPAIGFNPVSSTMYTDDTITIGYANTEAQISQHSDAPLISVVAPLEINPQIIYWDPETYPDIETLAQLGENDVTINVFEGSVYAEVFVGEGIWSEDQIDTSYDGTPGRFIAEGGKIAQQGFASAEPYTYENVFTEWGKPLAFQLLHDAGFQPYSQTLAVREGDLDELSPCLEKFVPVAQQAQVDFIDDAARANAIIIDTVATFDDEWVYDQGLADYSVQTQRDLGLVDNGDDDTLGNMDEARIQTLIDQMRDEAGIDVEDDLVAADLFTNEFIDDSIGLEGGSGESTGSTATTATSDDTATSATSDDTATSTTG